MLSRLMVTQHGMRLPRAIKRRNGVRRVIVRVTSRKARMGEPSDIREGAQLVDMQQPRGTRDAKSQKGVGCRFLPLGDKMDHWRAK
jgi:hypothetical protein